MEIKLNPYLLGIKKKKDKTRVERGLQRALKFYGQDLKALEINKHKATATFLTEKKTVKMSFKELATNFSEMN